MSKIALTRRVKIAIFMVTVVAAVALLAYIIISGNLLGASSNTYGMRETEIRFKYDFQSCADFGSGTSGAFYSTKDGMKYIGADGSELMSHTYTLISPVFVHEGDYGAVYEHKGKTLYVYDKNGLLYNKTFDGGILAVSMNARGYTGIITQAGEFYDIYVYNDKGIALKKYIYRESPFPISVDVSDDGRILAVAFLDFGGVDITSKTILIYINQSEYINYADGIFGSINGNSGQYLGMIKFMNGNNLLAVSDAEIALYNTTGSCEKKWSYSLGNKLSAISFIGTNGFAVALGKPFINKTAEAENSVFFYDLTLKKTGEYLCGGEILGLSSGYGSVLIEESKKITAVTKEGKELWSFNTTQDIKSAQFIDNTSTVLISSGNEAVIYKLAKTAVTTEAPE